MYGYLKARPVKREIFSEERRATARSVSREITVEAQPAGYLSWEGISYFFARLWTNGYGEASSPPPCKKLVETQVDSDLIKEQKRQVLRGLLGAMGDTMEYTVTSYDTLPKIALKFNVTPSELSRLNKLAIRTLYPGQVLRVPCPKPAEDCLECSEAVEEHKTVPQPMMMDRHSQEMDKISVAKRVSFEDIDEDVLESFIKIKSKYITDGQGVVKGILLITPHAVIFRPDFSEILVVDRGSEYYSVHFTMQNVCSAGLFDDIASMVVHEPLQPGHFFLDKPLMESLGDPNMRHLEKIKEEDSCGTLHPSTSPSDPSMSQEQCVESPSETTETADGVPVSSSLSSSEELEHGSNVLDEMKGENLTERMDSLQDNTVMSSEEIVSSKMVEQDVNKTSSSSGLVSPDQTSEDVISADQTSEDVISADQTSEDVISADQTSEDVISGDQTSEDVISADQMSEDVISADQTSEDVISADQTSEDVTSGDQTSEDVISGEESSENARFTDQICPDDVISSSSNSGVNVEDSPDLHHKSEQLPHVTSTEPALQMYSTPKLPAYRDVDDEGGIEIDKGYSEEISRDSGIHESREDVDEVTDEHRWIDEHDSSFSKMTFLPKLSTCHVDMPKYLCARIKRSRWRQHRPALCSHAHKAIQKAIDDRREFWFSIPSDRLLDVYAFFLEWCPAIHDGDTDDDEKSENEKDFVCSLDSDYSIVNISEADDEDFKVVDNVFSRSPEKENERHHHHSKKRFPSREKKKKKKSEPERKMSSWSMCSFEEPVLPEVIGTSEILTESHILQLSQCLPSRTIGHSWHLIYSTYVHGISLKTLYRTLATYDTPSLLVVKDDSHQVFGAFASSPFAVSEHFYGTGECFLYSFHPQFKAFRWSGENNFFIKGDMDALAFGGGQGNFGLWLDEDLYHGSSHRCKTYNNEPLTVKEDFLCSGVEIWCFE